MDNQTSITVVTPMPSSSRSMTTQADGEALFHIPEDLDMSHPNTIGGLCQGISSLISSSACPSTSEEGAAEDKVSIEQVLVLLQTLQNQQGAQVQQGLRLRYKAKLHFKHRRRERSKASHRDLVVLLREILK
jgi:hypothetical protein